jgi:hypothetical protein
VVEAAVHQETVSPLAPTEKAATAVAAVRMLSGCLKQQTLVRLKP